MAGYQHLDDLVSQLRTAFDEGASGASGGAGSGAGSKRSAAAVDGQSAEAQRLTDPDMQPGPRPSGLVGSDDPLRMGTASTGTLQPSTWRCVLRMQLFMASARTAAITAWLIAAALAGAALLSTRGG